MIKQFYFKQINEAYVICLLSVEMSNSFMRPTDMNLTGATIPGESGSKTDNNKGALRISKSFSVTVTSPFDYCVT